jgi:major membrane immunogen (membrane-anchored lipoprotein)
MKRKILFGVVLVSTLLLSACGNKDWFDTTYTYDRAIVSLPDGTIIDGKVDKWTDYEDGDQIQVTIDGVTYLVHSSNIALISETSE